MGLARPQCAKMSGADFPKMRPHLIARGGTWQQGPRSVRCRLSLLQERRDLEVELASMQAGAPDLGNLEKEFSKVAKSYSQKKKISYGAWREFGVPPEVLKKAGITRGG